MRRSKVRRFLVLSLTFITTVCFQNCGQEVTFDEGLQKGHFTQLNSDGEAMASDNLDTSNIVELVAITDESQSIDFETEVPPVIILTNPDDDSDSDQDQSDNNNSDDADDSVASTTPSQDEVVSENDNEQPMSEENTDDQSMASDSDDSNDDSTPSANDHGQQTAETNRNKNDDTENDAGLDSGDSDSDQTQVADNSANDENNDVMDGDDSSDSTGDNGDVPSTDPETYMYRCVLQGKGKSQHIGLIGEQIVIDKDTPDTLCMSENACLNIMPNLGFDVQGPQYTGYCKNGKAHTQTLTDSQAFALIAE